MFNAIVYLIIVAALAALGVWAVRKLQPPDPIGRWIEIGIIIIAALIVIGVFASMLGVSTGLPELPK